MHLTIDFETRSAAPDIKKIGAWKYSCHSSTMPLCLAVKEDDKPPGIWVALKHWQEPAEKAGLPIISSSELKKLVKEAGIIEAHNAFFERSMWENKMLQWHFPPITPRVWRCSAAKAAVHSLPRSLEGAGAALGLPIQKDVEGHRLMLKMCKPRKPRKAEKEQYPDWELITFWWEEPEEIVRLMKYCIGDVESEYALSQALLDLSPQELKVWQLDQEINARGINVDLVAARESINLVRRHEKKLLSELRRLTGNTVQTAKQVDKILSWLKTRGAHMENLRAATVNIMLSNGLPADAKRVLEIRKSLGKSSVAKFKAFVDRADEDGRVRDILMYHGASTGRWSGRGIQPQNFTRGSIKDVDDCIKCVQNREFDIVEMMWGDPIHALSSCVRGMIVAPKGKNFICADYSSIEGRGLAWVANEEYVLNNYRKRLDAYCVFASQIHGEPYEDIYMGKKAGIKMYEDMRFEGKTGELACGYQGGQKAVLQFAPHMPRKRRQEIVKIWRENRPVTVALWYDIERAAHHAVNHPGKVITQGRVSFQVWKDFLCCCLPSGRILWYYKPRIMLLPITFEKDCPCGGKDSNCQACLGEGFYSETMEKASLTYMGMDSYTRQWKRQKTYGGKLVENIIQGLCRDIMSEAMLRIEESGFQVVLTVHDEILAEVPESYMDLKAFEEEMAKAPSWAAGLPIAAEGWIGKRYRKG